MGSDEVAALAKGVFGIPYLFPYQRFAIESILDSYGRSSPPEAPGEDGPVGNRVVILPTGAGKSLCFQIPALLMDRPTIVVYPLLSLMEDQRIRLERCGIRSVTIRGGMSTTEKAEARSSVETGSAKIVISNPETLSTPAWRDWLAKAGIGHVAIDEAHCVTEWGESFRPAYMALGDIVRTIAPRAVSAFTATASERVIARIASSLFGEAPWSLVVGDPDRPNLRYEARVVLSKQREIRRLATSIEKPAICFVSSRDRARNLAAACVASDWGPPARFYHAALQHEEKREVEAWFRDSPDGMLFATCAYGMGVDKKDVRTVIHYDAPTSCEAYLQEAGRAGRDGAPARAVLLVSEGETAKDARGEALLAYARDSAKCRRNALLGLFGYEECACSGCDVCDGTIFRDESRVSILRAVSGRKRSFDRNALAGFLTGTRVNRAYPGWASLADFDEKEIREAVDEAIRSGMLRERAKGAFKGMLDMGRSRES
jgi:ATP-dependent DNA helicase RecQ